MLIPSFHDFCGEHKPRRTCFQLNRFTVEEKFNLKQIRAK